MYPHRCIVVKTGYDDIYKPYLVAAALTSQDLESKGGHEEMVEDAVEVQICRGGICANVTTQMLLVQNMLFSMGCFLPQQHAEVI